MLKKRNAQGLSIHIIIIAVLGLIILIAVILMLSGRIGDFSEGADKEVCAGENLWVKLGWTEDPCVGGSAGANGGGGNDEGKMATGKDNRDWIPSDYRLKENIKYAGVSDSGVNIYEFNFVWNSQKWKGVIAQELLETQPEAVIDCSGYYCVDYNKIDVDFEIMS